MINFTELFTQEVLFFILGGSLIMAWLFRPEDRSYTPYLLPKVSRQAYQTTIWKLKDDDSRYTLEDADEEIKTAQKLGEINHPWIVGVKLAREEYVSWLISKSGGK